MPFPTNEKEFIEQGYQFSGTDHCRGCKALIEWWKTPKGKWMPLDPGTLEVHWHTCPKAKDFKKK